MVCKYFFSMGAIKNILETRLPGVHVHSLMIGASPNEDTLNGFFMSVNHQIEIACDRIKQDPLLQNGYAFHLCIRRIPIYVKALSYILPNIRYNALGFSQGGQFLRAVAQRCPQGMKNLITFGGQHQGVYGLPKCGANHIICDYVRRLLNYGAYTSWVQDKLVQAQYWHDPLDNPEYQAKSLFLGEYIPFSYPEFCRLAEYF